VTEALDRVASCGYARPWASERWGVTRDYDRSGEDPVQMFTQRNSSDVTLDKAFARLPDGFRCIYRDRDELDEEREVIVWRKGREGVVNPRLEEIRYEGFSNEAVVIERATFDLAQAELRSGFWSFRAPIEAIRCRRGSLISLNHDMLDEAMASARIDGLEIVSGMVTAVTADSFLPMGASGGMDTLADVQAVADIRALGRATAIEIRQADGALSSHLVAALSDGGRRIVLQTPVALALADDGHPVIRAGCLMQIGRAGKIARRLVVAHISFAKDHVAEVTAVAEAPELWS
jgi:hypothetical protein